MLIKDYFKKLSKNFTNKDLWEKLVYVLNPDKNLMESENRLKSFFINNQNWKGFIGQTPDKGSLAQYFKSSSTYM